MRALVAIMAAMAVSTPGAVRAAALDDDALATLLPACAPEVHVRTMASIVTVESGGDPFAIHDNLTGAAYFPATRSEAVTLGRALIARGRGTIDVGIAQINSSNFPGFGVTVDDMFEPCRNLRIGAAILSEAYVTAQREVARSPQRWSRALATYPGARPATQTVLRAAVSIYNSNSAYASPKYVANVVAAAGSSRVLRIMNAAESVHVSAAAR